MDRRTFYLDDNSWHILPGDVYDRDGKLIELLEAHQFHTPDGWNSLPTVQTVYDLTRRQYVVHGTDNNEPVMRFNPEISQAASPGPGTLQRMGRR